MLCRAYSYFLSPILASLGLHASLAILLQSAQR